MKRMCAALLCLLMIIPSIALAEPVPATAAEVAAAIEAHLFGHAFSDMPPDELATLAAEEGAYDFIGRQNQDGTVRYLLGALKPGAAKPDRDRYEMESPSGLWSISRDGNYMLMQPGVVSDYVLTPVSQLFYSFSWEAGGLEALKDATERGVSFVEPPPPFAEVCMYGGFGGRVEYIPLDESQIKQFKRDKKIKNPDGYDYAIRYTLGKQDSDGYYKYVWKSVPASLVQLAIDKCNYEPPFKVSKKLPVKAVLTAHDYYGEVEYTQTLEDAESLKELVKILRSMKPDMVCKGRYRGVLVLTYADGTQRRFTKEMDGCGGIIMGSGASKSLGGKANDAFWKLFAELREATRPRSATEES